MMRYITIQTARPGIVIGKGGSEVEALKKQLKKMIPLRDQAKMKKQESHVVEA